MTARWSRYEYSEEQVIANRVLFLGRPPHPEGFAYLFDWYTGSTDSAIGASGVGLRERCLRLGPSRSSPGVQR